MVQEQVLGLYNSAGITLGKEPFNDAKQSLNYFQRGLDHADIFLTQGETNNMGLREKLLRLYHNYTSQYYNTGQIGQVIRLLPLNGLWSWLAADKLNQNNLKEESDWNHL